MTTPSNWQRKLLLIFLSEKRLNAGKIVKNYDGKSFDEMKTTIITESSCDIEALTDERKSTDLEIHLNNLKYQSLGDSESDYLLEHLSLRWIVSACDTFIDHSNNSLRAAILMNVITLMNTLRVHETKNFLQLSANAEPKPLLDEKTDILYAGDLPLYDGLTYFRIGTDDSLRNMRKRYNKFQKVDKLATTILLAVFEKLQNNQSAFATLRQLHRDDWSKWWYD